MKMEYLNNSKFCLKMEKLKKLEALFENLNLKTQGFVENLKQQKNKGFVWKFVYEKNV